MGSQEPSVRIVPEHVDSAGADAVKVLRTGQLSVDPWQANVLEDWMGRTEEGLWSAPSCGESVPRQNGKTLDTVGRMTSGMILYAEWIVYTAHLQKTATETFMEIKGLFETKGLVKFVKEIKSAIGREQIFLKNGGRVVFVARTRNGGRGLHGDCLVFDEAQELTSEQQASFIPAISASRNPQTIYLGTPPDENCTGDVFRKLREKAIKGESKSIAWTEFSVKEIGDVHDRDRWAATNPALGRRILESTIASEVEQMDADTFARERLGWWSPINNTEDYAIDRAKWEACKSSLPKPDGKTAYAVKFSADGSEVALCGAVCSETGEKPTFGQLSQGSIEPHVQMLRMLATQFSAATGLTVTDVGVVNDANPTSSEAILAQSQTLILLAEQLNKGNGDALYRISKMALAIELGTTPDELGDASQELIAHFKNPAMPSIASTTDAALKIATAREGFAKTDVFLEMIGFDQADIKRIRAQESRANGEKILEGIINADNGEGLEEVPESNVEDISESV